MHHQRRRKKRPNNGSRIVNIVRGVNGFGFTISGQQPCILSSIVTNSPADFAGLKSGDFLISVNGINVSKLPHEAVVQLIENSAGSTQMTIAQNYFSDSSEDEIRIVRNKNRFRSKYQHHHKMKYNRTHESSKFHFANKMKTDEICGEGAGVAAGQQQDDLTAADDEQATFSAAHDIIHSPNASNKKDISNVSAMVCKFATENLVGASSQSLPPSSVALSANLNQHSLEYRVIVGYLGTIEMPKQISTNSNFQIVRSCIRKLRQEKRNPFHVRMTILPDCLTLHNSDDCLIAKYPTSRLSYVSSNSDTDNRFFGLITSAIYLENGEMCELNELNSHRKDLVISNSCHIFVIDIKLVNHTAHQKQNEIFKIACTQDPISNLCLEFPNNSDYIVNLIRSMYSLKSNGKTDNTTNYDRQLPEAMIANSPQPSNHSELTTASSNSDSGIGFHNDCTNISDRIIVVDFPILHHRQVTNIRDQLQQNSSAAASPPRPSTIVHDFPEANCRPSSFVNESPDSKRNEFFNLFEERMLNISKSYDDILTHQLESTLNTNSKVKQSNDDITVSNHHVFRLPQKPIRKCKKQRTQILSSTDETTTQSKSTDDLETLLSYKLRPTVYDIEMPSKNVSTDNLAQSSGGKTPKPFKDSIWKSLQELRHSSNQQHQQQHQQQHKQITSFIERTCSEPDIPSRTLPNTSPFKRWGQSSFRETQKPKLPSGHQQRPSSLASDDVYTKSFSSDVALLADEKDHFNTDMISDVEGWSSAFEKLVQDAVGLQIFAEFLKKEFSAENIYFWAACERYRQMDFGEREKEAIVIFSRHLGVGAAEPVNVDSQARIFVEENLKKSDCDLFLPAQKQIFNLMKFDSYQRFIRSDLYKTCLECKAKNQPLPFGNNHQQFDENLKIWLGNHPTIAASSGAVNSTKLKKSLSNAEDRRRKSLLPWHRKIRCKSKTNLDQIGGGDESNNLKIQTNLGSDIHSSRSSLSSFDVVLSSRPSETSEDHKGSLCRVILTDGATTIVQIKMEENIRDLVERLLEKRGIFYHAYEVFYSGSNKAIDLDESSIHLAGKEVSVEERIVFKLDLPNNKVISVKSKPSKTLAEVLRPILLKYNYSLDLVQVTKRENGDSVNMAASVTVVNGHRLHVICNPKGEIQPIIVSQQSPLSKTQKIVPRTFLPANPTPSVNINQLNMIKHKAAANAIQHSSIRPSNMPNPKTMQQVKLDEITNTVFNQLLQGKVESHSHTGLSATEHPLDHGSIQSGEWSSDESSGVVDRLRRRNSSALLNRTNNNNNNSGKFKHLSKTSTESEEGNDGFKKPLIAKLKAGVKLQVTGRSGNHDFLEGLKRAQCSRLEDQRGTEINFELPDFLKNKENYSQSKNPHKILAKSSTDSTTYAGYYFEPSITTTAAAASSSITTSSMTNIPKPMPRLSIAAKSSINNNNNNDLQNISSIKLFPLAPNENYQNESNNQSNCSIGRHYDNINSSTPPPLPPKPKILPIKPMNWGQNSHQQPVGSPSKDRIDVHSSCEILNESTEDCNAYLDQPTSSIV